MCLILNLQQYTTIYLTKVKEIHLTFIIHECKLNYGDIMKEIVKCLSKYKWAILAVIGLLITQAYCNLALPTYTSNIVNVGIEQSGITSVVPIKLKESTFNSLLENSGYSSVIKSSYECISGVCTKVNDNLSESDVAPSLEKMYNTTTRSEIINNLKNEYKLLGEDIDSMSMSYIKTTGIKMIIVAILAMGITILSVYVSSKVSTLFSRDLRKKVVEKIISLETADLNNFSSASLITRCTNDITQITSVVTMILSIVLFAPILGIGAITKVINSPISWIIVLAVSLVLLLIFISFMLVSPKFKKFQELLDKVNLVSRESLTGLLVIRAFANKKFEEDKFDKANIELANNGLYIDIVWSLSLPTLTFIMNAVAILIIWVGAYKVSSFSMQVGDLIAFITYTMQIISSFLMMSMSLIMIPRSFVSVRRINEIFNTNSTIVDKEKTKKITEVDTLEFKDVYFRYNNATEDVLRDINFTAKKGTTTAFIGSTGSGKSTLINLIPRLFEVTSGSILIDGVNIKDVKVSDLRSHIGYVPQKGKLFKGTIMSNLTFAQKKKDVKLIEKACNISEAMDIVNENEKLFDREISEGGSNVSGGQKQRLSIARALAKDPDILIFDDSFSALDFNTDKKVRENLKSISKDKMIFVVAQRISSVINADNIIVLNNGEIVAMGKHEELINTCPIYKEIKISQLGGEEE